MSSDYTERLLANTDIDIIRDVLRSTGFQYEGPMGELDLTAARYALDLYQQGTREPEALIAAISLWAQRVSDNPHLSRAPEARP